MWAFLQFVCASLFVSISEGRKVLDSHLTITIHSHQSFSVVHFTCALAPTVIMIVFGSRCVTCDTERAPYSSEMVAEQGCDMPWRAPQEQVSERICEQIVGRPDGGAVGEIAEHRIP